MLAEKRELGELAAESYIALWNRRRARQARTSI
jgi:hypothetical protein